MQLAVVERFDEMSYKAAKKEQNYALDIDCKQCKLTKDLMQGKR